MSQILADHKSFTLEQTEALKVYLGLHGIEAEYFMCLVLYDRAGSDALKKNWRQKIENLRTQSEKLSNRVSVDRVLTDYEKAIFYSNPLYAVIQMYTSIGDHGPTLEEICSRFEISRSVASEMIAFLVQSELCSVQDGRYQLGTQKTHLGHDSPFLSRHHTNWRIRAIRRAEDLAPNELMYTSLVSLSVKDYVNLREEMTLFIKKILDQIHASKAEDLACFNLDFFWIKK